MSLAEFQFDLDGYLFGRGLPVEIEQDGVDFGSAETRTVDAQSAREDGIKMGRDYFGGRTITFSGAALTADVTVRDEVSRLAQAWNGGLARTVPGGVVPLTWRLGGRERRVYGRPRRFSADSRLVSSGWVNFDATFDTVDHLFYDATESAVTFGFVPNAVGGLIGPLIGPLIAAGAGSGVEGIEVGGTEAAWLLSRIDGPIVNPIIEVVGQWSATLNLTLAADQWVIVDPTPWGRTVRRNDGANMAGAFTAASQRLAGMRVPPGDHQVILRGDDPSGTSSLSLFWRAVHASY